MTSSPEQRLELWRRLLTDGGPDWLVDAAPRIIAQLESEIAFDAGEGVRLKGMSRDERLELLSRHPSPSPIKE